MKYERPFGRIRKQRGLTLDGAAARLDICTAYLRRLELGKARLSYGLAGRMSRLYEVSLWELIRSC